MKRTLTIASAALLSSAFVVAPSFAQTSGSSDNAPGQMKKMEGSAGTPDIAPGQMKEDGENATQYAPGQQPADEDDTDDTTTSSTNSASDLAPGQQDEPANEVAPGQQDDPTAAAPGQMKKMEEETE